MALDPATHTLYETNGGANTVSMIDTSTCSATNSTGCGHSPLTFAVGTLPLTVSVNQTTGTLYVGNAADNTLTVISVATCNVSHTSGCASQAIMHFGVFPTIGAVDEATDTIYVVNAGTGVQLDTVSVVDGATCNAHMVSGCGQSPPQVPIGVGDTNVGAGVALVGATHTLYVTNFVDNTVSMINTSTCNSTDTSGCHNTPPVAPTGSGPDGLGVNQATHTAYVANNGDHTVSVLDLRMCNTTHTVGCARSAPAVRTGAGSGFMAVDAFTNTVYVLNSDAADVSVVDGETCNATQISGCTRLPPTVTVGSGPGVLAVNNKTNTVYVTNGNDNTVSVINGARCNNTVIWGCAQVPSTVKVGAGPAAIAVDQATDTLYVPNFNDNTVSVIDGRTCNASNTSGCGHTPPVIGEPHSPNAVVVDQAADTVYVGNADGTVSVINGATCNASVTTGCNQIPTTIQAGSHAINDIAFNPLTHTVYATILHDGIASVINAAKCNATVTTGCGQIPPTVNVGPLPLGVRVDRRTNTVYVANIFTAAGFGNTVSVINGATCDASVTSGCGQIPRTLTVGLGPAYIAIDQTTDAIYVVNGADNSVSVIDGTTCNGTHSSGCRASFSTVQVGGSPDGVDVNSATGTVYVANLIDNNVSVFGPQHR